MANLHVRPKSQGISTTKVLWTSLCSILLAFVLLLTLLNLNKYGIFPFNSNAQQAQDSAVADSTEPSQEEGSSDGGPNISALVSQADTGTGPWIAAGHENYQFVITGVVPDEETKAIISRTVNVVFARFNTITIEVDPNVGTTAWTDSPEDGVIPMLRALAFRLDKGQFYVNNRTTRVEGEAPDLELGGVAYKETPQQVFSESSTLPSFEQEIEVIDLTTQLVLKASYDGESIAFSGALPTRELIDGTLADAQLLLGNVDISDSVTLDEKVFAPFPVVNFHQYIKAFALSREFDIGVQKGAFTGSITYGIQFAEDSSELPEQVQNSLEDFVVLLRRAAFPVEIVGHTDSTGAPDANLTLSRERAEAVRQHLVEAGELSEKRAENITATGKGSEEPIETNDTEEGRNLNRRVEISIAGGKPV